MANKVVDLIFSPKMDAATLRKLVDLVTSGLLSSVNVIAGIQRQLAEQEEREVWQRLVTDVMNQSSSAMTKWVWQNPHPDWTEHDIVLSVEVDERPSHIDVTTFGSSSKQFIPGTSDYSVRIQLGNPSLSPLDYIDDDEGPIIFELPEPHHDINFQIIVTNVNQGLISNPRGHHVFYTITGKITGAIAGNGPLGLRKP